MALDKISLIIQREYLTRVKKKSFLVMTIVGPLLLAALFIVPIWLTSIEDEDLKLVAVIDNQTNKFEECLEDTKSIHFKFLQSANLDSIRKNFSTLPYYALLYNSDSQNHSIDSITLSSNKQPSINVKDYITKAIQAREKEERLKKEGIDLELLAKANVKIALKTIKWTKDGKEEESSTEIIMVIGLIAAIIIYMFTFLYGSQVMRGVIEEKTNRIVEIIISSVKPFELMMGKIIGVALVALTQFLLWIILSAGLISVLQQTITSKQIAQTQQLSEQMVDTQAMGGIKNMPLDDSRFLNQLNNTLNNIPWFSLVSSFLLYFMGGYLLYTSLFAAIGSAVDNEADTQQFMLPVTVPLILAFVVSQAVIQNPEGPLAFWMSIIPFTSPIIMMVRIPFGVPAWEIALSSTLLILTFIGTTWLAAKIYRTGILMYGKKINYKELWKWITYKS